MMVILDYADSLQDKFSSYPNIQEILRQVKADKEAERKRLEVYYDDDRLQELAQGKQ